MLNKKISIETSLGIFDDKAKNVCVILYFHALYAMPSNSRENCHEKLSVGCISSF